MDEELSGPESIKAARQKWRRSQIATAAARHMEAEGFHAVSVATVAEEAGISVGTVYQYVQRKEDILLLVIRNVLESYVEELPRAMAGIDDPIERLAAGFRAYCGVVDRNPAATLLAYREGKTLDKEGLREIMGLELETNALLGACLAEAKEAGIVSAISVELVSYDLIMLAHMWALKRWHLRAAMGVDEYVDRQLHLMLRAVIRAEFWDSYKHLLEESVNGEAVSVNGEAVSVNGEAVSGKRTRGGTSRRGRP